MLRIFNKEYNSINANSTECSLFVSKFEPDFIYLQKEQFQMYSTYCQNKQSSEALRRQVGDNNPFFKVRILSLY